MTQDAIRASVERQAKRAIIEDAFFRIESAVIIAGTIVLSVLLTRPFPWWPWWGWPLLGLVAEIAIVTSSLTDKKRAELVVRELFRQRFNAREIRDKELRQRVQRALEYYDNIERTVLEQKEGVLRDHLLDDTRRMQDWLANIFRLARRVDAFRNDRLIQRDLEVVPQERARLERELKLETDPGVRQQLEAALAQKMRQECSLQQLEDVMGRAMYQLGATVSALGTVYSQIQLIGARDIEGPRAERVRQDIADQVQALQDLVDSINQVYDYRVEGLETRIDSEMEN
ncbi:MAG TPA: hypothetical protein EYH31_05120, partial [Anaerolineae bacterium]|nr:hypothetical protein [Anaerolineae bacterium]